MLIKWERLPEYMKTDEVREYYDILKEHRCQLLAKKIFDIVTSLALIVVLSPVLMVLSILIKVDSKGPIIYKQERVTTGGKTFWIFKFRTMVVNAEKIGAHITALDDPRITNIGGKLRKHRLDELPQLFNILVGDMSFVGTRPEVGKYVSEYTDEMNATLLLPAGVTSLASIFYKNEDEIITEYILSGMSVDEAYLKHILPNKMKYNLGYIREYSFWSDIKTIISTIIGVTR